MHCHIQLLGARRQFGAVSNSGVAYPGRRNKKHSEPRPDRVPVIGIKNIQDRLELNDLLYLSGLSASDMEKARISADWTVIVGSNGNRNRIGNAQLIRSNANFLFASFLIGAKPKSDSRLRPDYFFRWLTSEQVQSYLSASGEGTTGLSNLSHSFFKSMSIPVPPPEEQAAIARILDVVDTAIECTREAAERAQSLLASVVADLLGCGIGGNGRLRCPRENPGAFAVTPLGLLPRDWRLSTVGDEFDVQSGFTLNSERRPRFQKRRYLRVANVQRDLLDLSDIQELEAKNDEFVLRILVPDDLVVVEGHADSMEIGRCARVTEDAAGMTFQNHLFRLRTTGEMTAGFACMWLNSSYAKRFWNARCATSSGLHTINQRTLKQLALPVPSLPEQRNITSIVEQCRCFRDTLFQKRAKLQAVKHSLMHDLLTGKVRVGNLTEAPVS